MGQHCRELNIFTKQTESKLCAYKDIRVSPLFSLIPNLQSNEMTSPTLLECLWPSEIDLQ